MVVGSREAEAEPDGGEGQEGPLQADGVAALVEGGDERGGDAGPEYGGEDAGAQEVEGVAVEREGLDVEQEDEDLEQAHEDEGDDRGDARLQVDHEDGSDAHHAPHGLDASGEAVAGHLRDRVDFEGQ